MGIVSNMGGSYKLLHHLSHPIPGASVNVFMDKNYCLVRCMYMYFSFDGAFSMISNLFSGWPWTIMLFLCNNYVTVHVGKTVRGLWNVSSRVHEN